MNIKEQEQEMSVALETQAMTSEEKALLDRQNEATQKIKEDLEATIKLARMELSELQGLPLPSQ